MWNSYLPANLVHEAGKKNINERFSSHKLTALRVATKSDTLTKTEEYSHLLTLISFFSRWEFPC